MSSIILEHPAVARVIQISSLLGIGPTVGWYLGVWPGILAFGVVGAAIALEVFPSKIAASQSAQMTPIPNQSPAQPVDSSIVIPPDEHLGQHLYKDAFDAMACGTFGIDAWASYHKSIAGAVSRWVDKKYMVFRQAYPGVPTESLRARFYERAFREIEAGRLLDSFTAQYVIGPVREYVAYRFAREY